MSRRSHLVRAVLCVLAGIIIAASAGAPAASTSSGVQPVYLTALPDLIVSARAPAYTLGTTCSTGGPAIVFHLTVSNIGAAPSTSVSADQGGVVVQTATHSGNVGAIWSAAATLPPVPSHGSVNVDVSLMPLSPPSAMAGSHVFSVLVNRLNTLKVASTSNKGASITVDIPNGFCPHLAASLTHPPAGAAVSHPPGGLQIFAPPPSFPPGYDHLQFTIVTGSDNLRDDSIADAWMTYPDQSNDSCQLKSPSDDAWDNWSTHVVACKLIKPRTIDEMRKATIDLTMQTFRSVLESNDNWNVERVTIVTFQSGANGANLCLLAVGGDPLVRLKPSGTSSLGLPWATVRLSDFASQC
jgi:hypothetical protein